MLEYELETTFIWLGEFTMAKKKSEIYGALWEACNELRGSMDATQYKDYVLTLLFMKYISDKAKVDKNFLVAVPKGASFDDMVKLKGSKDIGEQINVIINKIAQANDNLTGIIDDVDFNDPAKLGNGKEMVDTLTGLISIFEREELDFSKNNAEGDDLLGDAYEYLMSNFAIEAGKNKGQFYTPAEVSRIMAKVIGADKITSSDTTLYDPTCGSGSLLLKVAFEAQCNEISIYGQEKDNTTVGLAIMNMYLHNCATAEIKQGNTLATPKYTENQGTQLTQFDYVVANPPFSDKKWSNGLTPDRDVFNRFELGTPPAKNGDYAFLLHVLKSMKQSGHGAIILPHGVLFRGNAEAIIRKNIVDKRWIKGIISLPANLFYGTGIPACILVLDKSEAETRKGIFMIDASKGFIKDGAKNRLRECDIKKIVDTFNNQLEIDKYSRLVPMQEIIEKNEYNLNIPRYIDSQEKEDIQDIKAHLEGGIPNFNVEELDEYWNVFPEVKTMLFKKVSESYSALIPSIEDVKQTIQNSKDIDTFKQQYNEIFAEWKAEKCKELKSIPLETKPKVFIKNLGDDILKKYQNTLLIDKYSVYQILLEYWHETMQDDVYIISKTGYSSELSKRVIKKGKKENVELYCELIPQELVANKFFKPLVDKIKDLEEKASKTEAEKEEFQEENCDEDSVLTDLTVTYTQKGKEKTEDICKESGISKPLAEKYIKANKTNAALKTEVDLLEKFVTICTNQSKYNKALKLAQAELSNAVLKKYPTLTQDEIKTLIVEDKWLATLQTRTEQLLLDLIQHLAQRVKELALRYQNTVSELENSQEELKAKVKQHLKSMGY